MRRNLLLCTDSYKLGHMLFYPKGTTKVYSYLIARSDKKIPFTVFYGLQYYLQEYLSQPITQEMVDEALEIRSSILGPNPADVVEKYNSLAKLGYLPLRIKAVPEGTIMPVKNVLMTMENTHPEFAWVVGYFESLILKVWNTTTVASYSKKFRNLVDKFAADTCDNDFLSDWQVHDFGYRGTSSEETAELSGSAHLINFKGTDTVPAVKFLRDYYSATGLIGASVPASEHSVVCAFGQDNELEYFENMLNLNPSGIVSVVSDTYDFWKVMTEFTVQLKDKILARDGKTVFRPDSGDPIKIVCGDPSAPEGSPAFLGAIRCLDQVFGSTVNKKGYRELNPKVGLIYGDGMYYERFEAMLTRMKDMGYASNNLVVGVGGLLLQQHSRDDQGFAIKATYVEVNGESREIMKDPVTDSSKKSHKGLLVLTEDYDGYITLDQCTREEEENQDYLELVFENGKVLRTQTLEEIRTLAKQF